MTTVAEFYKIDGEHVAKSLNEVREKLGADGEFVLDFSAMLRIDTSALQAIEDLAAAADQLATRIEFRGVNVTVYKVLKLARLTTRFSFAN
jgi:anti-anti-sigma regulatory factor